MAKPLEVDDIWLERIKDSVNGLEYGAVNIIIHDGRIVQIERTERSRFEAESAVSQTRRTRTTNKSANR